MTQDLTAVLAARATLRNLLADSDLDPELAISIMKVLRLLEKDLENSKATHAGM
jgi:hypothetical protein